MSIYPEDIDAAVVAFNACYYCGSVSHVAMNPQQCPWTREEDMPVNVFDAIRKATDPYGTDGEHISAQRPSAKEVLTRLGQQGFTVVPLDRLSYTFETDEPLGGIEQYQDEDR